MFIGLIIIKLLHIVKLDLEILPVIGNIAYTPIPVFRAKWVNRILKGD